PPTRTALTWADAALGGFPVKLRMRASVGLLTGVLALTALSTGMVSATSTGRTKLVGSIPAWANAANVRGSVNPAAAVGFRVYLGWRDQAGAEAVARAVPD